MMERKNVVGYQPKFFELDKVESLDVDDLIDFKIAELMYLELGNEWLALWNEVVKKIRHIYNTLLYFYSLRIKMTVIYPKTTSSMPVKWQTL